jgi:hypothetical protein
MIIEVLTDYENNKKITRSAQCLFVEKTGKKHH